MNSKSITSRFFENAEGIIAASNGDHSAIIHYLDLISSLSAESIYLLDLTRRKFCYVSPNASFLCGYSVEDALSLGYELYPKIVHKDDLSFVVHIHWAALRYLSKIREKRDEIDYFFYEFRLQQRYSFIATPVSQMTYHRVKPIWKEDKLAYFICAVGSSVAQKNPRPPCLYFKDRLTCNEYSFKTQRWIPVAIEPLTELERAMLILALQGKTGHCIAKELGFGYSNFRRYMSILYAKLGVNNMQEAVLFASNRRMIFTSNQDKENYQRSSDEAPLSGHRSSLTADSLQRIQNALDSSLSIRRAAKKESVSEGAIRYWIKHGKLKYPLKCVRNSLKVRKSKKDSI